MNTLLKLCEPAIKDGKKIEAKLEITNINRVTGTILSSEIAEHTLRKDFLKTALN